jgi:uncharacterized protein (TIGR02246 family)
MEEQETVRQIIDQHNANLVKWYASGDIDRVAEVFAEDCWQMPPHSEPMVGREALRSGWRQALNCGKWNFTLSAQDVAMSGDIAVERGKYTLRFSASPEAPPGMVSCEDKGNYVVLWRMESDNQWRIVWDAPVSELPV